MKFSIRDIMLFTAIVAISVAWWLDRSRLAENAAVNKAMAAANDAKLTNALKRNDALQKAFVTTTVDNIDLKSKVERLERENPPPNPSEVSEKVKAEIMEKIKDSFNSGRTYQLPGPPVMDNPPEL